jgi:hypothetical protein
MQNGSPAQIIKNSNNNKSIAHSDTSVSKLIGRCVGGMGGGGGGVGGNLLCRTLGMYSSHFCMKKKFIPSIRTTKGGGNQQH